MGRILIFIIVLLLAWIFFLTADKLNQGNFINTTKLPRFNKKKDNRQAFEEDIEAVARKLKNK